MGKWEVLKPPCYLGADPPTLTALSIECKYFNQALPYAHGQMNAITSSKALSSIVVVILSLTRNLG